MSFEAWLRAIEGGQFFTVMFTKRTTGETRTMICRFGVEKHKKGGILSYDPKEYKLLVVWDLEKQAYRQINLDGLLGMKLAGISYDWDHDNLAWIKR